MLPCVCECSDVMADSNQRLRDEMLCQVPRHLRDRFVTGSVNVRPKALGLLLGQLYFSPQNKGLVANLSQCTREAIELFAEPMQKELPGRMQLDSCFIKLYSNVTGQANHLNYHQNGNKRYTRVLVKVSSSGEIVSVVCFRKIDSEEEVFTIPQRSCTCYGGHPDVMTKDNIHGLEHSVPAMPDQLESRPQLSLPLTGSQLRLAQLACGPSTETPWIHKFNVSCVSQLRLMQPQTPASRTTEPMRNKHQQH